MIFHRLLFLHTDSGFSGGASLKVGGVLTLNEERATECGSFRARASLHATMSLTLNESICKVFFATIPKTYQIWKVLLQNNQLLTESHVELEDNYISVGSIEGSQKLMVW